MARGTVVGEPVVSQAQNKAFDEGYERAGMGNSPEAKERGRFIYDPVQKKLVRAEDYVPPARALDAPVMAGRFYENTKATDGEDIGSRAKHQRYMKERGWAPASDYSPGWYEKKRASDKRDQNKRRHETLERISYEKWKP